MKKLLTMFTAMGLSATSASPIIMNATKHQEDVAFLTFEDKIESAYKTNSLTMVAYENTGRNITKINNFAGEGLESSTNNYTKPFSSDIADYLLENEDVTIASVDGEFIANGFKGPEIYKSILLSREANSTASSVTFSGSIGSNMNAPEIKDTLSWQISLSTTIYKNSDNKAFMSIKLVHQATDGINRIDPESQEQGIKLLTQVEQTTYYRNNTIDSNQDLGNETIVQAVNFNASNGAVVTTKERVTVTSIAGLTNTTVDNNLLNLERTKRISFYGKMRNSVAQPQLVSHRITSSVEFIKNEQVSTDNKLIFESNYQTLYASAGVEKFNSTINFTFEINIDPITNIATFKNQSVIDLDNRGTTSAKAWMENTQVFDRATFWG